MHDDFECAPSQSDKHRPSTLHLTAKDGRNEASDDNCKAQVIEGCSEQLNSGVVHGVHGAATY